MLVWSKSPDSMRPGAYIHTAELTAGRYVVAQEIRVAEGDEPAEWGWVICDPDGYPIHMRNGFVSKAVPNGNGNEEAVDQIDAADVCKAHVQAFIDENQIT